MKQVLFILGVFCLQVAFGGFTDADISESEKKCLQELNLPTSAILENFNEDWTLNEGNSDVNNVILCFFRKDNYVNDDDALNAENFKNVLLKMVIPEGHMKFDNPENVSASSIDACKATQGSDSADTVVKIYNCVINYLRNHV